jgi:hypothetical protein
MALPYLGWMTMRTTTEDALPVYFPAALSKLGSNFNSLSGLPPYKIWLIASMRQPEVRITTTLSSIRWFPNFSGGASALAPEQSRSKAALSNRSIVR